MIIYNPFIILLVGMHTQQGILPVCTSGTNLQESGNRKNIQEAGIKLIDGSKELNHQRYWQLNKIF
jgi:hypothetical protein